MEDTNDMNAKLEEEREQSPKKYKEIIYSTSIFENQPQINFYKVEEEKQDGTVENIGVFILKYEIDGRPQEVIIGKLKNTNRAFEKAKDIKELMENQLRENSKSANNFNNFNQLKTIVESNNLPFELTMEGSDIITYTGKENLSVRRTYREETSKDKNSKIKCLCSPEEMLKFAREREINNKELFSQIGNNEKWNKNRVLILKILTNKEEQKKFLKGEKIANIVETTDEKLILQNYKELIVKYLKESYERDGNSTNELERNNAANSFSDYLAIKEKGIAISAKEILEILIERVKNNILEQRKNGCTEKAEIDNNRTLKTLENYSSFFDLIKESRNFNARMVAKKFYSINFSIMKTLFEKLTHDKELINYIELKGKAIDDIEEQENKKSQINEDKESTLFKRDMKFEYYQNNESVRELYNFLSNSSSREHTVVEEEKKLLDTFDSIKVELIKSNIKAIKSYNYYAEKSGMYVCPLPEGNETMREHKDTEKIVPVLQNLIEVSDEELKNQLEGNNKTVIDDNEQR